MWAGAVDGATAHSSGRGQCQRVGPGCRQLVRDQGWDKDSSQHKKAMGRWGGRALIRGDQEHFRARSGRWEEAAWCSEEQLQGLLAVLAPRP